MSDIQSKLSATEAIIGDETIIEAYDSDNLWQELPGSSGVSAKNGERPTHSVSTFQGVRNRSGELPIGTITITLKSFTPQMPIMHEIYENWLSKKRMQFRWTTPDRAYLDETSAQNETCSIASATGLVTFQAGVSEDLKDTIASDQIPEGSVLVMAGSQKRYVIVSKEFSAQGALTGVLVVDSSTGNKPIADVAAAFFSIVTPRVRVGPVLCTVNNTHDWDTNNEQTGAASQVMLSPSAIIPEPKVIA